MCELVQAKRATASPGRRINRGTVLCADDPVVVRAPGVFAAYRVTHYCASGGVEQATAAPGELRNVTVVEYACDEPGCTATAKSPAGLAAHKRSHKAE